MFCEMKTYSRTGKGELIEAVDLNSSCRLCLSNDLDQLDIFSENNDLASVISYFLTFEVCEGDGLPAHICRACYQQLCTSYSFYVQCHEADAVLRRLVAQSGDSQRAAVKEDVEDEPPVSAEYGQPEDSDCSALEGGCSVAGGLFAELASSAANESGAEDQLDEPFHELEIASSLPVRDSILSRQRKPRNPEADDAPAATECAGDRDHPDTLHALPSPGIDMVTVTSEEVTITNLFEDSLELGDVTRANCEEQMTVDLVEADCSEDGRAAEVEVARCDEATNSSAEVCYRLFYKNESSDDGVTVDKRTVSKAAQETRGRETRSYCYSGPTRMELLPETCTDGKTSKQHGRHTELECAVCYKLFSCNYKLDVHMRIHNGLRPFKCAECGSSFTQRGTLQNHLKKHSGEKPYACQDCGRSYFNREGLQVHARLHRSDPLDMVLHECPLCDKVFVYPSGLSRHLSSHRGRRFTCDHCHRHFRELPSLKRHIRNKHGFSKQRT
ncbi:zinc finger and BTB domain-containing protein 49-like isoform X1 [Bacillus rossius redtenbacheri]|uniref:zinc finger and BTB domain-containing protein 49-like isoform X1 n=1 Tax=Bacillus rossius redtenbacheri TaxID=93214 RepID=UPI002FDE79F7